MWRFDWNLCILDMIHRLSTTARPIRLHIDTGQVQPALTPLHGQHFNCLIKHAFKVVGSYCYVDTISFEFITVLIYFIMSEFLSKLLLHSTIT